MTCFSDFTVPLWKIWGGNLLMLVTIAFYIVWWTVSFRPNKSNKPAGTFFLIAAVLFGVAAIAIVLSGIESLSHAGKRLPVVYILLGAAAFYIVLLAATKLAFQRPVTSELLLITLWAALEGSAIAVVQGSGRFSVGQGLTLAALVVLATGAGLVCYVLHYRLDEVARFWNGLIPLMVDAGVVTVFLAMLALS